MMILLSFVWLFAIEVDLRSGKSEFHVNIMDINGYFSKQKLNLRANRKEIGNGVWDLQWLHTYVYYNNTLCLQGFFFINLKH